MSEEGITQEGITTEGIILLEEPDAKDDSSSDLINESNNMRLCLINRIAIIELELQKNEQITIITDLQRIQNIKNYITKLQDEIKSVQYTEKTVKSVSDLLSKAKIDDNDPDILWKLKFLLRNELLYPIESSLAQKPVINRNITKSGTLIHLQSDADVQFQNETKIDVKKLLREAENNIRNSWQNFMGSRTNTIVYNTRLFPYGQLQKLEEKYKSMKDNHIKSKGEASVEPMHEAANVAIGKVEYAATNSFGVVKNPLGASKAAAPGAGGNSIPPKKTQKTLAFYQNIAKSRGIPWRGLQKAVLITAIKDA